MVVKTDGDFKRGSINPNCGLSTDHGINHPSFLLRKPCRFFWIKKFLDSSINDPTDEPLTRSQKTDLERQIKAVFAYAF